jgi:cytolysin-activating lysine-acyltransferase
MTALESVIYLMLNSEIHKQWTLTDIQRLIIPPIAIKQCQILYRDNAPAAYMSWAYLTKEASEGYINKTRFLQPEDWNAGVDRWIIDFIAPFGELMPLVRELRKRDDLLPHARHMRAKDRIVCGRFSKIL